MYDHMKAILGELDQRGMSITLECSRHVWLVSQDGMAIYTSTSASDVNAFLIGLYTATGH